MRRFMLAAAALTIPISAVAATATLGGTAFAAVTITCTTLTGTASTTITVSGCTGGNTGGSSVPLPATALALGGTISWTSGSTTTIAAPTLTATSAKKCPGYVKGSTTNPTAEKFSAVVTADHGDGIKVPGKSKGAVCIGAGGVITALGPMKTT
jgi:hypothetical protein